MAADIRHNNDAKIAAVRQSGQPTPILQLPMPDGTSSRDLGQDPQLIDSDPEIKRENSIRVKSPAPYRRKPCLKFWDYERCTIIIDPHGVFYLLWLLVVTLSYCYNSWMIPLRWSFPYQTPANTPIWLTIDFFCDVIYLIDVAVIKPRLSFLSEGFWVQDPLNTRRNYLQKPQFKMDLVSLLPLEVLYVFFGSSVVLLRIPRFLKLQTIAEFYISLDWILTSPFYVHMGRTLIYILYLIHLNACAYYKVSTWEGIGSNGWVFSGVGNAYLRCFYIAIKTATSVNGMNPKPENELWYVFMTFAWLMEVFIFALLVGQIRDIIATATRSQTEYRKSIDETMEYMRRQDLPNDLQRRVKTWFNFTWEQQHTLDESHIINALPINLKTDVAINIHFQTLCKVQLFTNCDEALLRDLVLKLRPVIYLPGDVICHKGDVGKEMYIIKMGVVQVMGGENDDEVLATLSEGSVFGEISLLGINGAYRRTADVRSKGFSNLFVLSKTDLNSALEYHPEAQKILSKKAEGLMKKNAARQKEAEPEIIIGNPETPESERRLLQAVIEAFPEESAAVQLLRLESRSFSKKKIEAKQSPKVTPQPTGCFCEDNRRKSISKSFRGKKKGANNNASITCTNIYKMRNCASEPCLKTTNCIAGGKCCDLLIISLLFE